MHFVVAMLLLSRGWEHHIALRDSVLARHYDSSKTRVPSCMR